MKSEIYYWVVFVAIVIAAALYLRFYYKPQLNVGISFAIPASSNASGYVYQKIALPIQVVNGGPSALVGFNIGIFINGALGGTVPGGITLPAGKSTVTYFNYTPSSPGNYTVSAVGDPANLYNLANRNGTKSTVLLKVYAPKKPAPYAILPGNALLRYDSNMGEAGYIVASYLNSNYSLGLFGLSDISEVNSFFYPLLNLTHSYIVNLSYSGADYLGSNAFSLWISGYLSQYIISVAAQSRNLSVKNFSFNGNNVTVVGLGRNVSLCSWYADGWLKSFAYKGRASCTSFLGTSGNTGTQNYTKALQSNLTLLNYSTPLADFSFLGNGSARFGRLYLYGTTSFLYTGLWSNNSGNSVCFGLISTLNGTNYCSVYLFPKTRVLGNLSLIRTTEVIGGYNASVLSLVNTSKVLSQAGQNIAILHGFGLAGKSLRFTSGISNSCSFALGFSCSNLSYTNSNVTLTLRNTASLPVRLNSISCTWNGNNFPVAINSTLTPLGARNITTTCYNYGFKIAGLALSLNLRLSLNYTINGTIHTAPGRAFVV